jgi:hypothetical protein
MNRAHAWVIGAVVVVAGLVVSAEDYVQQERTAADQETMKEMNQLCKSTITPFDRNSPVGSLSKQTMDNIELAGRNYCSGTARARAFDSLSLYNIFGGASRARVCPLVESTKRCLQFLHQRVRTRQQPLPPDFETRFNALFQEMKIPARTGFE